MVPSGVVSIVENAFANKKSVVRSITIPTTVASIGANAFSGCSLVTNTIESLTLTSVGAGAFNNCPITITTIDLSGSTLTSLGANTFKGSNLKNIRLPKTINTIGTDCFNTAAQMESITFHAETPAINNANISSQVKATDIYLPSSVFANNVLDPATLTAEKVANIGKIWATSNYKLSMSNTSTTAGPVGKKLPDGKIVPMIDAGMILYNQVIDGIGTTQPMPTTFISSIPSNEISIGITDNITIHRGFKVICTSTNTGNPNNNTGSDITIPGNGTTSSYAIYLDNSSNNTNLNGTVTANYPKLLLFYDDKLVRILPASS